MPEEISQKHLKESGDCRKSLNAQQDQQRRAEQRENARTDAQQNASQQQERKEEK